MTNGKKPIIRRIETTLFKSRRRARDIDPHKRLSPDEYVERFKGMVQNEFPSLPANSPLAERYARCGISDHLNPAELAAARIDVIQQIISQVTSGREKKRAFEIISKLAKDAAESREATSEGPARRRNP